MGIGQMQALALDVAARARDRAEVQMRPSGLGSRVDAREYGERVGGLLRRRVVIASRQRDSTGGLVCAAERQAEVGFGRDLECLRAQRLGPIEMSRETVRFRQKRGEPGFEGSQS